MVSFLMMKTMKAAIFHGPSGSWPEKPMTVSEVPMPRPAANEVLVKVAACGVCRTDLEYLKESPPPKAPPIILGHEPSGTIVEVGPGVKGFEPGQRVLVSFLVPCRSCEYCRRGQENLCSNSWVIGADRDGAFAEYVVAPAISVYPLPSGLPLEESCIISDAVATSYHAIHQIARVRAGDTVAIYGASGGLGLICVQFASALGATVIGVGRKRWKLEKARELGAREVVSIDEVPRADQALRKMTGGGADISVDVTGIPAMVEGAFKSTRPGGRVVVVGFSFQKIQLDINRLMWFELEIHGCRMYNPVDLPKVLKLVENGVVDLSKVVSNRFKLEDINEAYQTLDRGDMLRGIVVP